MKSIFRLLIVVLALVLTSCSSNDITERANSFVSGFTSGSVSRTSPVYLILSEDIPEDKRNSDELSSLISISPGVKGTFSFVNERTVMFKPEKELERDTKYRVKADLSKWFDAEGDDKEFEFGFKTLPFALMAELESLDVNPNDENTYNMVCRVSSQDKESPEVVEKALKISEKSAVKWSHAEELGRSHTVVIEGVKPDKGTDRDLTLAISGDSPAGKGNEILKIKVPAAGELSVCDVKFTTSPERCVIVTFNENIDQTQELEGIVQIDGVSGVMTTVSGNKVKLYPPQSFTDDAFVIVGKGVRSNKNHILKSEYKERVRLYDNRPMVEFTGDGSIIPVTDSLIVPFRAISLRGVIVRVIRISEQNIGQFLQSNTLGENNEIKRVGELVARKTIFLDDAGADLSRMNTYAVDLRELMTPDPGAIYHLEISFNQELAITECDGGKTPRSKEEIMAADKVAFEEECNQSEIPGYYYYFEDYIPNYFPTTKSSDDDDYYDPSIYENPCRDEYYQYNKTIRKNVLATNLGVIAKKGSDGNLMVSVHNLITVAQEGKVTVSVYGYRNNLIASSETADDGMVWLDCKGAVPYYLVVSKDENRTYLRLDEASALSMSSFDTSGGTVQRGIKGFIYGERGVWRPGDKIHLGFIVADKGGKLPANHPVVAELFTSLGQLYSRKIQTTNKNGLYVFEFETNASAPTGSWLVKVNVGGATFEKNLRIETVKPNRLKISLPIENKIFSKDKPINETMHVEWLQGASSPGLKYEITGTFLSLPTEFPRFKGYIFDDPFKKFETTEERLASGNLNASGDAVITLSPGTMKSSPGLLTGNLVTKVFEEGGGFSTDAVRVVYSPYSRYVGIKSPQTTKERLITGKDNVFSVACVDAEGKAKAGSNLKIDIYEIDWYWWFDSNSSNIANYMSGSSRTPYKSYNVTTSAGGTAPVKVNIPNDAWGTYIVSVTDLTSGHSSGVMAFFDWADAESRIGDRSSAATALTVTTDKSKYKPGEKINVSFPSSSGSRAVISVESGARVLSVQDVECKSGSTTLSIEATPEMQPNVYIGVSQIQPYANSVNNKPIRLYGVVSVTVEAAESHLEPVITAPAKIKPDSKYQITVSEKRGTQMGYTLAVVDEGLLDITRFKTPDPWSTFFAREALGVNTWDMYNYVLGAYGGRIEQLFSIGGDYALRKGAVSANRFKPVVSFIGPFLLKKGERQSHTLEMPEYIGKVKIMVVAAGDNAYGSAEKSVVVSKPVMVLGTLPRVIGTGEEMLIPATVFSMESSLRSANVSINCSGGLQVVGAKSQALSFKGKGDKIAFFKVKSSSASGVGSVVLTATGGGETSVYKTEIDIRNVSTPITTVKGGVVGAGATLSEKVSLQGVGGSNNLTLEVSGVMSLNITSRLSYLIGYPYGCLEQITSKGFPQIYLPKLTELSSEQLRRVESSVKSVIDLQRSYATASGGLAYWPGSSTIDEWTTTYAVHFIAEAEAAGYMVHQQTKTNAINYMRRMARNWKQGDSDEIIQAYRLYVLALTSNPEAGAMNRMKAEKIKDTMAAWLLSMAYSRLGRSDIAATIIPKNINYGVDSNNYWSSYGSKTRNRAIILMALCDVNRKSEAMRVAQEVSKELSSGVWLSTQSTSFAFVAINKYLNKYSSSGKMEFSYTVNGSTNKAKSNRYIWSKELVVNGKAQALSVDVKNTGGGQLFVRVISSEEKTRVMNQNSSNGLSLDVSYISKVAKTPIEVSNLKTGTSFVSVITVKNTGTNTVRNIALTEIIPAGWEILNTRFMFDNVSNGASTISYRDIRDDRANSFIDKLSAGESVTVTLDLIATYAGVFYLPPVSCQAMYDNTQSAVLGGSIVTVNL